MTLSAFPSFSGTYVCFSVFSGTVSSVGLSYLSGVVVRGGVQYKGGCDLTRGVKLTFGGSEVVGTLTWPLGVLGEVYKHVV